MSDNSGSDGRRLAVILDDDEGICSFMQDVLENMDYRVIVSHTTKDFRDIYTGDEFLIFVDLMLGQDDGIEVLRYLAHERSEAYIIPITGYDAKTLTTATELARVLELNVIGHLEKPIRLWPLEELLKKCEEGPPRFQDEELLATLGENELREAFDRDLFIVHYQPQVDSTSGKVVGIEALVRLKDPDNDTLVYPKSIIGPIEDAGYIRKLTWTVLKRALQDYTEIFEPHFGLVQLGINMPPSMLSDRSVPDTVETLARENNVPTERITIEVTEAGLIQKQGGVLDVLARLRLKGMGLSIDDFGTGYSMLQQLIRIPATEVKIDQEFVQNMQIGRLFVVVKKTIELAHEGGMTVVGEGVETESQFEMLRELGCETVQGFLVGKPVSAQEFVEQHSRDRSGLRS